MLVNQGRRRVARVVRVARAEEPSQERQWDENRGGGGWGKDQKRSAGFLLRLLILGAFHMPHTYPDVVRRTYRYIEKKTQSNRIAFFFFSSFYLISFHFITVFLGIRRTRRAILLNSLLHFLGTGVIEVIEVVEKYPTDCVYIQP